MRERALVICSRKLSASSTATGDDPLVLVPLRVGVRHCDQYPHTRLHNPPVTNFFQLAKSRLTGCDARMSGASRKQVREIMGAPLIPPPQVTRFVNALRRSL